MDFNSLLKSFDTDSFAPILYGGMIFSTIGTGVWVWGKKQASAFHMLLGAVLFFYPYFTSNLIVLYGAGVILTAMAFVFKD